MINTLLTHDGAFQADEVLASLVLMKIFNISKIIRTRDTTIIKKSHDDVNTIVYDVGMIYDPLMNNYDHHMIGAKTREDGVEYSAFGLIWLHFKNEIIQYYNISEYAWKKLDETFVYSIDANDTGYKISDCISLPEMIQIMNNTSNFEVAVLFARNIFDMYLDNIRLQDKQIELCESANKNIDHNLKTLLIECNAYHAYIEKHKMDLDFVIYPEKNKPGIWRIDTIHIPGNKFIPKKPLSLEGFSIPGITFIHKNKFTAGGTSVQSLMDLILLSVK